VGNIFRCDGEVVDFVCELVVCLNGSDVGVDEDGLDAGFLESLQGLGTCFRKTSELVMDFFS
jgi:hypothetical protein